MEQNRFTEVYKFIEAYCAAYGCTVQKAQEVYRQWSQASEYDRIANLINWWVSQARLAFYCD